MAWADIRSRLAILQAIQEFDRLGRERFLAEHNLRKALVYVLEHEGRKYDAKALLCVAHGYEHPRLGPLAAADFRGNEANVKRKLEELGFKVAALSGERSAAQDNIRTSARLSYGAVYTREDLKRDFGVIDATINTGIFQPKGTSSIWLFVTEQKTSDRTQYLDRLEGTTLRWQGQTGGRKDSLIIEHEGRGLELLVFYRSKKYEFAGAGFRYEGRFKYVEHRGANPANFVLARVELGLAQVAAKIEGVEFFDPSDIVDGRERTLTALVRRQGQATFREALLAAYDRRCCVTGCSVESVLEAAHIVPYRGSETNHVQNGLLLRADIHTLFDLGLITVDSETQTLIVRPPLNTSEYANLEGCKVQLPVKEAERPSVAALDLHRLEAPNWRVGER